MKNIKRIKDLTGQRFGRLTVIGLKPTEGRHTYWYCKCDCGNIKSVRSDSLSNGSIKSCGCLKKEQDKLNLNRTTHNMHDERIYKIWQGIKKRCYNSNNKSYPNYGGRGIKMCDEWKDDFVKFYEWVKITNYNDSLSIERIDVDGDYEPNNCTFATNKQQCNNRRSNIKIKIGNTTKTLTEWCELFQLEYRTILSRYKRNKDITLDDLFRPIS